jgi:hypothetical protein
MKDYLNGIQMRIQFCDAASNAETGYAETGNAGTSKAVRENPHLRESPLADFFQNASAQNPNLRIPSRTLQHRIPTCGFLPERLRTESALADFFQNASTQNPHLRIPSRTPQKKI